MFFFFKGFIYLFLETGEGREKGRETSICGCLSRAPYWGPGPQPKHVPWLGIELVALWFTGEHPIHWATPARDNPCFSRVNCILKIKLYNSIVSGRLNLQNPIQGLPFTRSLPKSFSFSPPSYQFLFGFCHPHSPLPVPPHSLCILFLTLL